MFLATTALTEFWDPQEEILFLGPWCRRYDLRRDGEGLPVRTLPSPWEDREKFHAAADYLDGRIEAMLPPLAETLNRLLGQRSGIRYWRILIGTWLMHSLHVTYDRAIHLQEALTKHPGLRTLLLDPASFQTPEDTRQTVGWMMTSDSYNLQLFSQLLTGMGHSFESRSLPMEISDGEATDRGSVAQRLRETLRGVQSGLLHLLGKRAGTRLVEMYCPTSVQWRLYWQSGFRATPWSLPAKEGTASFPKPDARRQALSALPADDEFTRLWTRTLPQNFPWIYLEGFHAARERALERLRHPPRTLVSATGWHYSEPFKFLAAELSERKGRLVAVQHGSGYGLFRSMPMETHERRVSDAFLGWGESPALQFAAQRPFDRRRCATIRRQLLYVASSNPRYPFRFYSAPQAHQLEVYFQWQVRFLQSLGHSLRGGTTLRLHPLDFGHGLRERLGERFAELRWDSRKSFAGSASASRLIVVDHPGTSMLASLSGNFPTLLFWEPRLWEFRPDAKPYVESLRQAGIFHDDPESAARALGEILLEGPDAWWDRPTLQKARRRFLDRYAPCPTDWSRQWLERLR